MVTEVAFSHDGKRIFVADWAGAITVWDAASQKQIGTIAANPPTIAQRISTMQEELKQLPLQVAAAEKTLKEKTAAHTAAKAYLTKVETDHRNTLAKYNQLTKERTQLDAQLKKLYAEGEALNQVKQQHQQALTQARDALRQHNKTLADTRAEQVNVENEVKKLAVHETHLVKVEEAARKKAAELPEDPALKQAAAKAKADLDNHRKKLAETRHLAQQKSTAIAQLTQQQQGPGNKLAAADKTLKDTVAKLTAHYEMRKPLQEKHNSQSKPITDTLSHAKNLETLIKPAREKIKPAETALNEANQSLAYLRNKLANQGKSIKRWQAAAINTEALKLAKEAAQLTAEHYQAMDTFTALAKEIQSLKDSAKLAEKSRELQKLRAQIDQSAPSVLEKANQAQSRKQAYLEAIK
jgi:chromosome segregation ATPase